MSKRQTAKGNTISIIGHAADSGDRGRGGYLSAAQVAQLSVEQLQENLAAFTEKVSELMKKIPNTLGEFTLDEITLALEISATGQVSLLGTGFNAGGKGGVTLKLKRSK